MQDVCCEESKVEVTIDAGGFMGRAWREVFVLLYWKLVMV